MDTHWGRRVSHTVFWVTVILTLSSDPSFRKIVSRAYILYCFKVGIPNLIHVRVPECPVLAGLTLNLTSGTSPILSGGRNLKFSVWIPLWVVECHTLFIDQCVSFMKIYCLWGYFINL